jgi:hypothetical protein
MTKIPSNCRSTLLPKIQGTVSLIEKCFVALVARHSGHRVRLQNRRSRVRIPPGCKVFGS